MHEKQNLSSQKFHFEKFFKFPVECIQYRNICLKCVSPFESQKLFFLEENHHFQVSSSYWQKVPSFHSIPESAY